MRLASDKLTYLYLPYFVVWCLLVLLVQLGEEVPQMKSASMLLMEILALGQGLDLQFELALVILLQDDGGLFSANEVITFCACYS